LEWSGGSKSAFQCTREKRIAMPQTRRRGLTLTGNHKAHGLRESGRRKGKRISRGSGRGRRKRETNRRCARPRETQKKRQQRITFREELKNEEGEKKDGIQRTFDHSKQIEAK